MLDKIERLARADDFVIYRWITHGKRIENQYYRLADVRLQGIRYGAGKVSLFEAAAIPIASGPPNRLLLRSSGIFSILDGDHAGLLSTEVPEGASFAVAQHTGVEEITQSSPRHKLELVRTLVTSPYLPVCTIVLPNMYRLTRNPARLRLHVTQDLLDAWSLPQGCSSADIDRAFQQYLDTCASNTGSGYIVPADMVHSGGTIVCDSMLVSRNSTSSIFGLPGATFDAVCAAKLYQILGKEKYEVC